MQSRPTVQHEVSAWQNRGVHVRGTRHFREFRARPNSKPDQGTGAQHRQGAKPGGRPPGPDRRFHEALSKHAGSLRSLSHKPPALHTSSATPNAQATEKEEEEEEEEEEEAQAKKPGK